MLRDALAPSAEVTNISNLGTETVSTDVLDGVPHIPTTPVTPVTIEALTSLQGLIIKDTHVLKRTSKDRLQRQIQKLASAAKVPFAKQAFLKNRN